MITYAIDDTHVTELTSPFHDILGNEAVCGGVLGYPLLAHKEEALLW